MTESITATDAKKKFGSYELACKQAVIRENVIEGTRTQVLMQMRMRMQNVDACASAAANAMQWPHMRVWRNSDVGMSSCSTIRRICGSKPDCNTQRHQVQTSPGEKTNGKEGTETDDENVLCPTIQTTHTDKTAAAATTAIHMTLILSCQRMCVGNTGTSTSRKCATQQPNNPS